MTKSLGVRALQEKLRKQGKALRENIGYKCYNCGEWTYITTGYNRRPKKVTCSNCGKSDNMSENFGETIEVRIPKLKQRLKA